jgi:hypothetical protein
LKNLETNKLQWDQHINNITAKANKTLGFLRRNLKIPSIRIKDNYKCIYMLGLPGG